MDDDPVFANCPEALKKFATKFSTVKTSLSFDFLDQQTQLRSMNISSDNNRTLININDWIVSALKDVILRMEEHGEILTVHTEALANPQDALSVAKHEEVKALKEEIDTLNGEIDETRQRGMKGNLIISSPQNGNADTIAKHEVFNGKRESDIEMVARIVKMKTGVEIDPFEVSACHRIGKKENHAYVIRLNDRKNGSAWHNLSEGMMTGKSTSGGNFVKDVNVFLNFQLTQKRAKLARVVRLARKDKKIYKFYINQNGVIKVKKTVADNYIEVKSEFDLNTIINS